MIIYNDPGEEGRHTRGYFMKKLFTQKMVPVQFTFAHAEEIFGVHYYYDYLAQEKEQVYLYSIGTKSTFWSIIPRNVESFIWNRVSEANE